MTRLSSRKRLWQWVTLLAYLGILFGMGFEKVHRSHPAIFFCTLLIMTLALVLSFRLISKGESEV